MPSISNPNIHLISSFSSSFALQIVFWIKIKIASIDDLHLLHEWVNGSPVISITNTVGINIVTVEKVCKKQLSYGLSMYFGHLIDLTDNEDEMEKLQFIQKRVKYGLPDKKSIDLYESGLADRFICQKVIDDVFLTQQGMDTETFLEQFPDWIRYRYNSLKAQ